MADKDKKNITENKKFPFTQSSYGNTGDIKNIESANPEFIKNKQTENGNTLFKQVSYGPTTDGKYIDSANPEFIKNKQSSNGNIPYTQLSYGPTGDRQTIDSANPQFIENGHLQSRQSYDGKSSTTDPTFTQSSYGPTGDRPTIPSANPQFIENGHLQSRQSDNGRSFTTDPPFTQSSYGPTGDRPTIKSANPQFIENGHIQNRQSNKGKTKYTQSSYGPTGKRKTIKSANPQFIENGHLQSRQTEQGKSGGEGGYATFDVEVDMPLNDARETMKILRSEEVKKDNPKLFFDSEKMIENIMNDHGMYKNINLYDDMYWWGYFNRRSYLNDTIEYVFFTKPDLHLTCVDEDSNDDTIFTGKGKLIKPLADIPYFNYIAKFYPRLLDELQISKNNGSLVFSKLLFNQLISNVEIPSLDANTVETASNRYGVSLSYRGSSEASNDNFDFSLEFKDDKDLDMYHYFKVYEEYETLKHHGIIQPAISHIEKRTIHDAFSIYKFLIDKDAETVIYWCKYYGVIPKSLPRDTFSTSSFDSGLSYSINFKASFFEDMTPEILEEFNNLYLDEWNMYGGDSRGNNIGPYIGDLDEEDRDNFHTNINYTPVHAAQVRLIEGNSSENQSNSRINPGPLYRKNDGSGKSRFVLEFR